MEFVKDSFVISIKRIWPSRTLKNFQQTVHINSWDSFSLTKIYAYLKSNQALIICDDKKKRSLMEIKDPEETPLL